MKPLLAVTPFTGSEALVSMTANMLARLRRTAEPDKIIAVANKPWRLLTQTELSAAGAEQLTLKHNTGFGPGVNAGIEGWNNDVLVLNNDLEFPQEDWLTIMRAAQREDESDGMIYVYAPRTNRTATPEACKDGPADKQPTRLRQVSAYCWLVPALVIHRLRVRGRPLFPEEFPNYGSDDSAAAWIRKLFGATPFKVVHRAFVKHAKGRTAKETGDRAGDPSTVRRLHKYLQANKLP